MKRHPTAVPEDGFSFPCGGKTGSMDPVQPRQRNRLLPGRGSSRCTGIPCRERRSIPDYLSIPESIEKQRPRHYPDSIICCPLKSFTAYDYIVLHSILIHESPQSFEVLIGDVLRGFHFNQILQESPPYKRSDRWRRMEEG